jgi:glycosyltransferase involved in cell wall biosynthesis
VLVYRFPWEVAESMQRLGAAVFLDHPEYAWRIWTFYNRHLLDFHRRHPERSVLASANGLLRDPERFAGLLTARLGLQLTGAPLDAVRDPDLFASLPPGDPLMGLAALAHPEAARLLAELDAAADLPATGLWDARPPRGDRLRPQGEVDLSVVIPCFDQGELLVEAVASVERAAPERCELIVIDDGSRQPRTLEVLGLLRDAGYRVISQPNAGLAGARNRGIRESRGRYILPLDADNRLLPGFPAAALRVFEADPGVGVVYGDRLELGARNQRVTVPDLDLDTLLWANFVDACAAIRREVWEQAGGYDPEADAWEDWDLWLGAAERGWRFHRLPDPTFEYRVRPGSMLAHAQSEGIRRTVREHIYRKHRDLYRERFAGVLLAGHTDLLAVREGAEAFHRHRDHLQAEVDRVAPILQTEREAMAGLTRDRDSLATTREALLREIAALNEELARWRERVATMEGTAAWRLRGLLVRLRRRLGGG